MSKLTQSIAWQGVQREAARLKDVTLLDLFAGDSGRWQRLQTRIPGLLLDFSKQNIDVGALTALVALAEQQDVAGWRTKMLSGIGINHTEKRAVLHTALRRPFNAPLPVDERLPLVFFSARAETPICR